MRQIRITYKNGRETTSYDTSAIDNFTAALDNIFNLSLIQLTEYVTDEAKKNFNKRSFENVLWKETMFPSMSRGNLANSLKAIRTGKNSMTITSSLPYGSLQNYGGNIKITDKMRSFFWSQYYSTRDDKWKALALTKKTFINVPARPFIVDEATVTSKLREIILNNMKSNTNKNKHRK